MAFADDAEMAAYERASPSLLASMPVTDTPAKRQPSSDWVAIFNQLQQRLKGLNDWRYSWWVYWSKLAEYFIPFRYVWLVVANRMWRGGALNDAIIDDTGLLAVRTCRAGMYSGLTNPSRRWFNLSVGIPGVTEMDEAATEWMSDSQEKAYTVLAESNFYTTMSQMFADVVVFGTGPVIVYEDVEQIIRCYLPAAGEYFLANGANNTVETLYREFTMTVIAIIEKFGYENCPEDIRRAWTNQGASLDQEFVICHAIEPNFDVNSKDGRAIQVVPRGFAFREAYWVKGITGDNALSLRGFHEAPFGVARWDLVSNNAYGRSPCMDALGDNKQVQVMTRRIAEYIEKGVRPPMGADVSLKNEPASIVPSGITYMDMSGGAKKFEPLFEPDPAWLPGISKSKEDVNARIDTALFVNLFMAITRMEGIQPKNELELTQRNLERLQELGPFIDLFENEFIGKILPRVFNIMLRRKMLKPLPPSLQGVPLKINYVSIMKLAQNATASVALKDTLQTAGLLDAAAHSSGRPPPSRTIDLDAALKEYGDKNDFPAKLWLPEDVVKRNDAAAAKAAAAAQIPGAVQAAADSAKTLSQASLGGGNALGAMLGQPANAA